MKKFRVEMYELYSQHYIVEAESEADACLAVMDGGGEKEGEAAFLQTAEDYGMSDCFIPEAQVDEFIDKGLLKEDGFVDCIRSIEEMNP